MLPEWQKASHNVRNLLMVCLFSSEKINKRVSTANFPFETALSARQIKSVYNQTYQNLISWETKIEDTVRSFITFSNLDDETKITLYRLNSRKAWFYKEVALPIWVNPQTGELSSIKQLKWQETEENVLQETLKLLRHIAKQAIKTKATLPELCKSTVMLMDGIIANVQTGENSFDYWLKISTLTKGKPILIPLKSNPYFESRSGELANFVQVQVKNNTVKFTLQKKVQPEKSVFSVKDNKILGADFGMVNMFADSEGGLYGTEYYSWLGKIDIQLMELQKELQKRRIPLKTNKRYGALQLCIREHSKNEMNRLLNRLALKTDLLVLEKLDFRGKGLSKTLNRLLTRYGRSTLNAKLSALQEEYRLTHSFVNPAYTSQECSGCGFVSKNNRSSQNLFSCKFCGKKIHADNNAAKNIKERFLNDNYWLYVKRDKIRHNLDERFHVKWSSPNYGANEETQTALAGSLRSAKENYSLTLQML